MVMTDESKPEVSRTAQRAAERPAMRIFELGGAADALFRDGYLAQSYRLAVEQLSEIAGPASPDSRVTNGARPEPGTLLDQRLQHALAELRSLGVPSHDGECTPQHEQALRSAIRLAAQWLRTKDVVGQQRLRIRRATFLTGVAILVGLVLLVLLIPHALQVNVSSQYSAEFEGKNVIDGSSTSEWLLPDAKLGWVELRFRNPRQVHNIRVQNAVNRHYRDRATRAFNLDVFRGDKKVAALKGEFPPIGVGNRSLSFPLTTQGIDRVLLSVESFHGSGGGIAEIELD
jgi:hypothetical protein